MSAEVVAVHRDAAHRFSKAPVEAISLRAGRGVLGDAHFGSTVQHRSRVRRDPSAPNLRQVHLVGVELLDELVAHGFRVAPGVIGENVTTRGLDLVALPTGTRLDFDSGAALEVTGLRNPCVQLDGYQDGFAARRPRPRPGRPAHPARRSDGRRAVRRRRPTRRSDQRAVAVGPAPSARAGVTG